MSEFWSGFVVGQAVWLVPLAIVGLVAWLRGGDDEW